MKCVKSFFFLFIFSFLVFGLTFGKNIKPRVLVYGDDISALAASLQSARSGVPTIWVLPSNTGCSSWVMNLQQLKSSLFGTDVWSGILKEVNKGTISLTDSIFNETLSNLNSNSVCSAFEKMIIDQSNLTVLKGVTVVKLVNDEKKIDVTLSNRNKFTVFSVIDATLDSDLKRFVNIEAKKESSYLMRLDQLDQDAVRSILVLGKYKDQFQVLTVNGLRSNSLSNLLFLSPLYSQDNFASSDLLFRTSMGQALGAAASYCAFFKTTLDKIDVRKVQAELLSYRINIMSFQDVSFLDPNFESLQKTFLVNLLPVDLKQSPLLFSPSDSVKVESIRPVAQQLYSRAQLWFVDNREEYLKTKDLIELLKMISFRGEELEVELKKSWVKRFHFKHDFSLTHTISRYEFSILMDAYANPFSKKINHDGVIQR